VRGLPLARNPWLNTEPGLDLCPPGKQFPSRNLQAPTLDSEPSALSYLAGSSVVINVWGSWCALCWLETADLVALPRSTPAEVFASSARHGGQPGCRQGLRAELQLLR
jgi:hypothetical protein